MSRLLRGFATAWTVIVGLTLALACIGAIMTAPTLWSGAKQIAGWFSPFNILNWLAVLIFYSPALGAWWLADRVETRRLVNRDRAGRIDE